MSVASRAKAWEESRRKVGDSPPKAKAKKKTTKKKADE